MNRNTLPWPDPPSTPTGFKPWGLFVGVLALGLLGLVAWAVITLVTWVTAR